MCGGVAGRLMVIKAYLLVLTTGTRVQTILLWQIPVPGPKRTGCGTHTIKKRGDVPKKLNRALEAGALKSGKTG
jgi:hypothetical protein